jgi:hypothetical protein
MSSALAALAATAGDGGPSPRARAWMDRLGPGALTPDHPDAPCRKAALKRWLLYVRSHWIRMPPFMLLRHLTRKAFGRVFARTSDAVEPR